MFSDEKKKKSFISLNIREKPAGFLQNSPSEVLLLIKDKELSRKPDF